MLSRVRIESTESRGWLRLVGEDNSRAAIEQVFLVLSPDSDGLMRRTSANAIEVSQAHFLGRLQSIRLVFRRLGVGILIDDDVRPVFEDFNAQRTHLKDVIEAPGRTVDSADLLAQLRESGFARRLTAEQLRDVSRLVLLRNGANFSVPGAGKTTALLAVHAAVRRRWSDMRLLIVAPRNAFISWDEELVACFSDGRKMIRLTGGRDCIGQLLGDNPLVAGITYQQLPLVLPEVEAYLRRHDVHLVLDESHRAKGGQRGVQGAAILRMGPLAARRDILSGTPMPQGIADLVPQFDFLWPGMDVCRSFKRSFTDAASVGRANSVLRPLFTRTTKRELGLPPIEMIPVGVQLGAAQAELYALLKSEAARIAQGVDPRDRAALRAMGRQVVRLIQAASNPFLLLGTGRQGEDGDLEYLLRSFVESERSAKIVVLEGLVERLLKEDPENKVVVWSTFVSNLAYLERRFAQYNAVAIHGAIPTGDDTDMDYREARIRRFNDDTSCRVMVANPAACGEGISLHRACHNAIYLDRSYNAAHFLQSVDRIHRLGLPATVRTRAWVLTAVGTVDESLTSRLDAKVLALGRLLDDATLMAMVYDPEDAVDDVPAGLDEGDMESVLSHVLSRGTRDAEA